MRNYHYDMPYYSQSYAKKGNNSGLVKLLFPEKKFLRERL